MKSVIFAEVRTIVKILSVALLLFAGASHSYAASESVKIRFRFGKSDADLSKLEAILSGPDASKISGIEVKASSSPDGPYWVNKQLAEDRASRVINKVKELCPGLGEESIKTSVVAEDWSGVARWLRRSDKAYKDEALKIVTESDRATREEKLQDLWAGEAWDDLMRSAFPALRAVTVTIVYNDSIQEESKVSLEVPADSTVSGQSSTVLLFPAGIRYVQPEFANNATVLQSLKEYVADCKSVRIDSYASPEGDPACNASLAKKRAECVRAYLVEIFGVPESKISVESRGEDWAGLREEVEKNYEGTNRDSLLGVLGDSSIPDSSRKAAIRALDGGATWRLLVASSMDSLRSVRLLCYKN